MRTIILLNLIVLLVLSCAGNKSAESGKEGETRIVFLTVKNTLNTSAGIYWQGHGSYPSYLGRVKAGKKKKFVIENVFYTDRVKIIARPNLGSALVAQIPVDVEDGKIIVWELSRNFVSWKTW